MNEYQNFVFSGGGVLGIAYMGMLEYLYRIGVMSAVKRVAGTSAGAITACIAAFNLPFADAKRMADSLDYSLIAAKSNGSGLVPFDLPGKGELDSLFGNVDCAYRLIKDYGWYSSEYFYDWLKARIAEQFDPTKKLPPYTFGDFADRTLHKNGQDFKELYVVGTDLSTKTTAIFCKKDTPDMEVAEAVRISMSVPLFFEAVHSSCGRGYPPRVYADGGLLFNYPITLFDKEMPPSLTLGAVLKSSSPTPTVNSLLDYVVNLMSCSTAIQRQLYENSPLNQSRSIAIDTGEVPSMNFDIKAGDPTYRFLYNQGYTAAEAYFGMQKGSK